MTDHEYKRRRRGPGLSQDYLRQIEDGEIVPTPEELDLLGEVYEMTEIEQRFLYLLASNEVNGPAPIPDIVLSTAHRCRVDTHSPLPAAVLDHRWNILYANPAYRRVLRGIGAEEDNFLDWMFLDDNARSIVIDFATEARQLVGRFRFAIATHPNDPQLVELLERCYSDDLFITAWDNPAILADGPATTAMHWYHRDSGRTLRVIEENLPGSQWLTVHLAEPAD